MFRLITPITEEEQDVYYQFRWGMLREPWRMPKGSERDAYDGVSMHRMIVNGDNDCIAIGRLYITPDNEGQVRFMAVHPDYRHKGLGALILMTLESLAQEEGAKRLVCNAREDAILFFQSNGFESQGELNDERGPVRHQQMLKYIERVHHVGRHPEWCQQLQDLWDSEIPISSKMGVKITQYTGYRFAVTSQLNANTNPQATMFSGSIFTMATLAGWGFVWMLLRERQLHADIVLVDSHIRYREAVTEKPKAVASIEQIRGDLDRIACGRKGRVTLDVTIFSDQSPAAHFKGTYLLLPSHETQSIRC